MLHLIVLLLFAFMFMGASADENGPDRSAIEKGRYLFHAANCYACHTDVDNDEECWALEKKLKKSTK